MEIDTETRKLCDDASHHYMIPYITQVKYIYIDAEMMYDFKLSAMLANIRNEEDYKYIWSHIQEYLKAPTLECAKFFPKFGLTEEDIYKVWNNPENSAGLAALAPGTKVLRYFEYLLRGINTENESKETREPLEITINQSEVKLHDFLKRKIERIARRVDPDCIIKFTDYTWDTIPKEVFDKFQVICVYDIAKFVKTGSVPQLALATGKDLTSTNIVALVQSTEKDPSKVQNGIDNFIDVMGMMCGKFSFIEKTLLGKEEIDG